MNDFDALGLHAAMDAQRTRRGLSWPQVARELWGLSSALNELRQDHPISASTLTGIAKRADCTCQHALFILRWLNQPPEAFFVNAPADPGTALPAAGKDQRLRWDLEEVYEALNQSRLERQLTWRQLATELGCTEHQIRGLRTARYAIGMRLMMRIVSWLERPAATFIHPARW